MAISISFVNRKSSYIKILKSNRPRIEPFLTWTYLLFIMTLCFPPLSKYRLILVRPYQNHKHVILQWENHVKSSQMVLTNALKMPQNYLLCLYFFFHFSASTTRNCWELNPFLNPHWCFDKIWSKWVAIPLNRYLSHTLDKLLKILTGR